MLPLPHLFQECLIVPGLIAAHAGDVLHEAHRTSIGTYPRLTFGAVLLDQQIVLNLLATLKILKLGVFVHIGIVNLPPGLSILALRLGIDRLNDPVRKV